MQSPKWISYEVYYFHTSRQDARLDESVEDHWDFVLATTSEEDANRVAIQIQNRHNVATKIEKTVVDGGDIFGPN